MTESGLEVYCFFDAADAAARAALAEGAAGDADGEGGDRVAGVGWIDLGNPQT